jgi:hypothetical protein
MSFNRFYRFIIDHVAPGKAEFQEKTNRYNHAFVMRHLPLPPRSKASLKDEKAKTYRLASHHLSFYDTLSAGNPFLSQYHITAFFTDEDNKTYQYHVYYDSKDCLTTAPVFSLVDGAIVSLDEDFAANLLQFTVKLAAGEISRLRRLQQSFLSPLLQRFTQLESDLQKLSVDLTQHRAAYSSKLDEIIEVTTQLTLYHDDVFYVSLLRLFRQTRLAFTSAKPTTSATKLETETTTESKPTYPPSSTESATPAIPKPNLFAEAVIAIGHSISTGILSLKKDERPQLDQSTIDLFLTFARRVHEANLLFDDEKHSATLDELNVFQQAFSVMQTTGKRLLQDLLLANRFELAASLRQFVNPVPEALFKIALSAGNAKLLDFLLTHGDIPVNTFTVKDGFNPVMFCVATHNATISKAECLAVLVKHKANVLIEMPDGFSAAHHVFSSTHASLAKALADHLKQAELVRIFSTMLEHIEERLNDESLTPLARSKLMLLAKIFMEAVTRLEDFSFDRNKKRLRAIGEIMVEHSQDEICTAIADMFSRDAELQQLNFKLNFLAEQFLAMQPPAMRRAMLQRTPQVLRNVHAVLSTINVASLPELRDTTVQELKDYIELYECQIAFNQAKNLSLQLNSSSVGRRKPTKEHKGAVSTQNRALSRIRELTAKYPYLDADNKIEAFETFDFEMDGNMVRWEQKSSTEVVFRYLGTVEEYRREHPNAVRSTPKVVEEKEEKEVKEKKEMKEEKKEEKDSPNAGDLDIKVHAQRSSPQ